MEKLLLKRLKRLLPPGIDPKGLYGTFIAGLVIAMLSSLSFWLRYTAAFRELYETVGGAQVRIHDAMMPDFAALLGGIDLGNSLFCFLLLALILPLFIIYHYAYYRRGARSDYLMRRLPKRWAYHGRCVALPLAASATVLAVAFLLLLLYFGLYMLITPGDAISPGQWMKIWSVI